MMAAILNSAIMDSAILHKKTSLIHSDSTWWWQPSWSLPCWIQTLPSWIQTPLYFLSDSLKNTLTPFWLWLKLFQSESNSFILTQLDDGSNLEFCQFAFSHLSFPSQTNSHLPRLVPTICTKKTLTHLFWLNLIMAAILNSAMLDSDTAILDSDTLLSTLIFTQKHSHSTLTLTQTNSIWLKLIHSHWTWWWQQSWILPSWIRPCCTKLWLNLIQSDSNSFILTQLDDGSHLEFHNLGFRHCHLGFRHLVIFSQIHSKNSSSTLTLTQTNSIWLKLIHSYLTWWW